MQKTIKLAYDWYAPEFPLNNNQSSFVDAIEKARKIPNMVGCNLADVVSIKEKKVWKKC